MYWFNYRACVALPVSDYSLPLSMAATPPSRFFNKPSVRLAAIAAFMLLALAVFWLIIHEVLVEKEYEVDTVVIHFISAYTSPWMTGFMKAITFLASSAFLLPAYILLVGWFLFHRKKKKVALNVALNGITGFLLVFTIKNIFRRDRPMNPLATRLHDYSFPSGHTTSGFIFYGLLIYLVWQSKLSVLLKCILSILLLFLSILIGISRIYLGMHFPSDVIAGFCLGFVWLSISLLLLHKLIRNGNTETTIAKTPN